MNSRSPWLKPILRWAGSKRQLTPVLAEYYPPGGPRYVEPFAGSACLFFRLLPEQAILADINTELMTTYAAVSADPASVHTALSAVRSTSPAEYYRLRSLDPSTLDPWARAARFLFLNRYCFNGLYRTDKHGRFNVPYGSSRVGRLPTLEELAEYSRALGGAELLTADFEETVAQVRGGDFVYMDPPYAVKTQWRRGRHYTDDAFAVDDVDRLRSAMSNIDRAGATFLVSYADSEEGHLVASGWRVRTQTVRRSIAGSTFKRTRVEELLISNGTLGPRDS